MADSKTLKQFHVEEAEDGFRLQITDDSGGHLELAASREQIDLIVDSLDDLLNQDDSGDEVDEDELEDDAADVKAS